MEQKVVAANGCQISLLRLFPDSKHSILSTFSSSVNKKSQEFYSMGFEPATFAFLEQMSYQLDYQECLVARDSLNPIYTDTQMMDSYLLWIKLADEFGMFTVRML